MILGLFVTGVALFPYRGPTPVSGSWELSVLLIGMLFVLLRTLYFGAIAGYVEYRYALVVWPFVIALAMFGVARIWPREQDLKVWTR